MRSSATALTFVAIGAILTFAVNAHPSFLNLQIAGVVIMAVGLAGLFLNRRGYGWLRRRIVLRRSVGGPIVGHVDEANYPSYAMIDPQELQSVQPIAAEDGGGPPASPVQGDQQATRRMSADERTPADAMVMEEYIEE
jgi:predicted signal transduction protein with EAL and GGDEF domain